MPNIEPYKSNPPALEIQRQEKPKRRMTLWRKMKLTMAISYFAVLFILPGFVPEAIMTKYVIPAFIPLFIITGLLGLGMFGRWTYKAGRKLF